LGRDRHKITIRSLPIHQQKGRQGNMGKQQTAKKQPPPVLTGQGSYRRAYTPSTRSRPEPDARSYQRWLVRAVDRLLGRSEP
jgi:hypothetical protein